MGCSDSSGDIYKYTSGGDSNIKSRLDTRTDQLCKQLRLLEKEAPHLIDPDLQAWWDEHKDWDRKREKKEKAQAKAEDEKKAALAKLSPKERELLGFGR